MIPIGGRLPAELELAEQFGVAVATLRKGLSVLRDRKIIETRRGRNGGSFVINMPALDDQDEVRRLLVESSVSDLRDLGDEHIAVATAVAKLACARAYPRDFERLHDLASRMTTATTLTQKARADSRFHIEIAVLAQSPRLMRSEIRLQNESSKLIWSEGNSDANPELAELDHIALVQAIQAGDVKQAKRIAEDHIRKHIYQLIDTKITLSTATNNNTEHHKSTAE